MGISETQTGELAVGSGADAHLKKRGKRSVKRAATVLCALLAACWLTARPALAEESGGSALAVTVISSDGISTSKITDGKTATNIKFSAAARLTLTSDRSISGLYIEWNKIPGKWNGTADGVNFGGGENGFLHEYLRLPPSDTVTVEVPSAGEITDIYAFGGEDTPDWVQKWEPPCPAADLLLFATHSDDDQLFFAGLLPYYAVEYKADCQVVYLTHHWNTATRQHEELNGLWTAGVRHYPVVSEFPDLAASRGDMNDTPEEALARGRRIYNEDEWVKFETEMLRRFRPQVVVGHDLGGEYRHGAHALGADALTRAVTLANDPSYDPDSAAKYGAWDVPKTYLHLYAQNPVVMNWDTAVDSLGGKTPFEVSKAAYACHVSQQWTWFTDWISKNRAADIAKYSPCRYGLYRSTVGPDINKNDLLENITKYSEQSVSSDSGDSSSPSSSPSSVGNGAEYTKKSGKIRDLAVVAAASVLALALVIFAVLYLRRRRKKK